MNIILFQYPDNADNLLPLTFTRPIADLRCGILTQQERYKLLFPAYFASNLTPQYQADLYPLHLANNTLLLNAALIATPSLATQILNLTSGEALCAEGKVLAANVADTSTLTYINLSETLDNIASTFIKVDVLDTKKVQQLNYPEDIFGYCAEVIKLDFALLTQGRQSQPITDKHTIAYNTSQIFLEEGVQLRACILNAEDGPIYLGKNSTIQEGAIIHGPFSLGEGATVNMGGKMRGDSSVGPLCKVGGEISNSVLMGCSNKGHDGFLGNSVIGYWCNLGADTNTSNLKNTYKTVSLYHYPTSIMRNTGKTFCGLIMADHSKCSINTMFNTGTVVGVGANIFDAGFPPNHVPSFSWGGAKDGFKTYRIDKMLETETIVFRRRKMEVTPHYEGMLRYLHAQHSVSGIELD